MTSDPGRSATPPVGQWADAIGHTPLVRLQPRGGQYVGVWAKLESGNPVGSSKDRTARGMIEEALASGRVSRGGRLVESSSGNFGVAMAALAAAHGLRFTCVIDPRTNTTSVAAMRALGAEVVAVQEPEASTGDWLAARIARVREICAADSSAVWLDQYTNQAAVAAHRDGTMSEIVDALDGRVDWVFAATSTTGTLGGCRALVDERGLSTRLVAVDAEGSVLFGGARGPRLLPGYGAGVVPGLAAGLRPDRVERVADGAAVAACRAVARREGLLLGASGGAVCAALYRMLPELPVGATVALVLADGGSSYLNTVYADAWVERTLGISADELSDMVERSW